MAKKIIESLGIKYPLEGHMSLSTNLDNLARENLLVIIILCDKMGDSERRNGA